MPLIDQDPEEKIKISHSLERVMAKMQTNNKNRNYSEIHSERLRQRSLEKDVENTTVDSFYRNREIFVKQNHRELFIKPNEVTNMKQKYAITDSSFGPENTLPNHSLGAENVNKLNTDLSYTNQTTEKLNKFISKTASNKNKKKKKVVVMKKRDFGIKRSKKKLTSRKGVIHLATRRRKSENQDKADLIKQGQQEFLSLKTGSNKSSFTVSSKTSRIKNTSSKLSSKASSVDRKQYYMPISERLIQNSQRPYIFIGTASYTQKGNAQMPRNHFLTEMLNKRHNSNYR